MRELQLDPRRTGIVVFDMLEAYRPAIELAGTVAPVQRLLAGARAADVPIFWARADHRADGADFARTGTDTDQQLRPWTADNPPPTRPPHAPGSPGLQVLAELGQRAHDYDVPKHRWSAFFGTHLELSLRSRDIDTILLVGGSTHVGIASTAYAARTWTSRSSSCGTAATASPNSGSSSSTRSSRGCAASARSTTSSRHFPEVLDEQFRPVRQAEWGSDVMVDVLRKLGLKYVTSTGSSFRGLHDSLVNYGGDEITMIEVPHEKLALGVAHGYGHRRPMADPSPTWWACCTAPWASTTPTSTASR